MMILSLVVILDNVKNLFGFVFVEVDCIKGLIVDGIYIFVIV